jgi:hypothetical protein
MQVVDNNKYGPGEIRPKSFQVGMGFPVGYTTDMRAFSTNMTRFTVTVDNKAVPEVMRQQCSARTQDEAGHVRYDFGYYWDAPIEAPSTSLVEVRYAMFLKETNGVAAFDYFVRCGGNWDGPIHK